MVSPTDASTASTESVAHSTRRAHATVTLRRGRTRRGFWVTVTAQDPAVVNAVERAVLGAGIVHDDGDRGVSAASAAGEQSGAVGGPVRWSYEWADLLVREEADGAYHVYRRRVGHEAGSDGLQLEELMMTASREHALLEMGAFLEASNRSARATLSAGRVSHEQSPARVLVQKAA